MFKPSQWVECINAEFNPVDDQNLHLFSQMPVKGLMYTVRDVYVYDAGTPEREPAIFITVGELTNARNPDRPGEELAFDSKRFAPFFEKGEFDKLVAEDSKETPVEKPEPVLV